MHGIDSLGPYLRVSSPALRAIVGDPIFAIDPVSIQTDDFSSAPPPLRMVSAAPTSPQEEAVERALRPKLLDEYVGQAKVREQIGRASCRERG